MKFEVDNNLPDIPEKVQRWAEDNIFRHKGFMYYKKRGRYVDCFCAGCGESFTGVTEENPDLEGLLERVVHPVHGQETTCPICGNKTEWKAAGMHKRPYYEYSDYELVQKQKDHVVYRTVSVTMKLVPNKKTQFEHSEFSRLYMKCGEGMRRFDLSWSYKRDCSGWEKRWRELKKFTPDKYSGNLYPPSRKVLKNHFKYIPEPPYSTSGGIKAYYSAAAKYKDFEMVVKLNMDELQEYMMNHQAGGANLNLRAKTIEGRLRIEKSRLKDLVKANGNIDKLRAYQIEKKLHKKYKDEDIAAYITLRRNVWGKAELSDLEYLLTMYRPEKILKYIDAQVEKSERYFSRHQYFDYLRMRRDGGYDLSNEIYAFPKDLARRHDELVYLKEKIKRDKRIKEKEKQFTHIAENYKKLEKKYGFTAAGLVIRPAKSAGEIIEEGATLHHCVGSSDTYMCSHNKGESYILFLRKEKTPDEAYITVQLAKDGTIKQWFGEHDTKPNKKKIDAWLSQYRKKLKEKRKVSATA